ncbi:BgTH12-02202 [Blumeria graminis f. sp. triticale]|uniref:BgTH12-02202 n=1 Tax=Blumeria graminis f. sp. triticale TaxID=1689686 RepID=A0A9W4DHQ2_BLUGR|nr:BgTH12-02202 [Blumeria graminis f. sp. triticale]
MMSSDESSELSSVPSDNDCDLHLSKKDGILKFFTKQDTVSTFSESEASPPRSKRSPSPPHDYILGDNPDIAFIVMFRSRFTEAFPKSLVNFGPQELEQDISSPVLGDSVESFLCALLGLLLNRKQDVKPGHYQRALEEAIQTHKSQWAKDWEGKSPLAGGVTFVSMTTIQRLTLLRILILWALSSSEVVKGIIQSSYKQNRQEDDLNQALSVQPWGCDSEKRRYYLIEGLDDTQFRVYRESNYKNLKRTWWSVASNIDELKALGEKLRLHDDGQKARLLSGRILAAIPRFETAEEKRKRREHRTTRKQQTRRPEFNYSLYEGRTRGKRIKYTFSDEDDENSNIFTTSRRSTRNEVPTSSDQNGHTVTQSGRQVRSRQGGTYGESVVNSNRATATGIEGEASKSISSNPDESTNNNSITTVTQMSDVEEDQDTEEQGYDEYDEYDDEENKEDEILQDSYLDDIPTEDEKKELKSRELLAKNPAHKSITERKTLIKLRISPAKENNNTNSNLAFNYTSSDKKTVNNPEEKEDQVLFSSKSTLNSINPVSA